MGKKIIRPVKGMDVDSSLQRRDDNHIYSATNMRPNSTGNLELGEYTNIKGILKVLSADETKKILKISKVGNNIILFVNCPAETITDYICLINESDIGLTEDSIELNLNYYYWNTVNTGGIKVASGDFGFDEDKEIIVKTYYESDDIQKIYWTIEGQPLRILNVIYSESNDPSIFTANDLAMIPSVDLEQPIINDIIYGGSLLCGKIYYAYKVSNSIGVESNLSEFSAGYSLTKSEEGSSTDYDYQGYGVDVDSAKSVSLSISNVDSSFNYIKVYSIHYVDGITIPTINLIFDGNIASDITLIDSGISLQEYTVEEFLYINSTYFTGGKLEIKNNRLFVTNYEEEYFDIDDDTYWDSRAYRFSPAKYTRLFDSDGNSTQYSDSYDFSTIPEDADCINGANDINSTYYDSYLYKKDGSTFGAEGINVSIEPEIGSYVRVEEAADEPVKWYSYNTGSKYKSYANFEKSANEKTFKLEEIYRLAIQFKNSKGQYSYVKWICDYRYNYDATNHDGFITYNSSSHVVSMQTYKLNIIVSNIPIDPETGLEYEYRIMYVPITDNYRSVYFGLFQPLTKRTYLDEYRAGILNYNALTTSYDTRYLASSNSKYLEFINPEYCFGDKKTYSKYKIVKSADHNNLLSQLDGTYQSNIFKVYDFDTSVTTDTILSIDNQYDIEYNIDLYGSVSLSDGDSFLRSGETLTNLKSTYYYGDPQYEIIYGNSNKGRCQIIETEDGDDTALLLADYTHLGFAYVNNIDSKYGGKSYLSRFSNNYIPLTKFVDYATTPTIEVFGDSYCSMFEYLRQISENSNSSIIDEQDFENEGNKIVTSKTYTPGVSEIVIFPVISSLNLKLRNDEYFSKMYLTNGSYMLHEYAGVYTDTLASENTEEACVNPDIDYILTQDSDLYLYNKAYSREVDSLTYMIKPQSSAIISKFKTRINSSQNKVLGETVDSFLKISSTSYIDVDGQYGEINSLITFNDRLYFSQEKAIGIVSVNERSQTIDTDENSIGMGEIGLLSRFDYLSVKNGITDIKHILNTDDNLYIIDSNKKDLLKINRSGKIEKISLTKTVNSIVKNSYWNDSMLIYNKNYSEILFTYKEESTSTTQKILCFNEQVDAFTCIYNFDNSIIDAESFDTSENSNELLLNEDNDLGVLNSGDYNKFYDSFIPSEITFLISNVNADMLLYNVVEFIEKQVDSNGDAITSFIDTIRIYNEESDTGELDYASSVAKKFGKTRTSKLRNYEGSNERILSDHIYVTITTTTNKDSVIITSVVDDETVTVEGLITSLNYRIFIKDLIVHFSEYNKFG